MSNEPTHLHDVSSSNSSRRPQRTLPMTAARSLLLLIAATLPASAAVALASPFTDHAVLQRDQPVPVWGFDTPGSTVTVTIQGLRATATTSPEGRWRATLPPLPVGGPYELTVAGSSKITLHDLLVGEVWLCSGQSNMEYSTRRSDTGAADVPRSANPRIRLLNLCPKKQGANTPQDTFDATWTACTPASVGVFSAVGYYFGRELERELQVPVGIINASWSGTAAEAWISQPSLEADPEFKKAMPAWEKSLAEYPKLEEEYRTVTLAKWEKDNAEAKAAGKPELRKPKEPTGPTTLERRPGGLFNGMIAPLTPYALHGVVWYQGEANAGFEARAIAYRRLLPLLIADWRRAFTKEISFHIVQLANFNHDDPAKMAAPWPVVPWPILRESQAMVAATVPHSGLAVAIDIGNPEDIHPSNKYEVGRRLALSALARDYGKNIAYSGPVFKAMTVAGNVATLSFDHAEGLKSKDGALRGFVIAGEDGRFVAATATIEGSDIRVSHPTVTAPVSVRYNWASSPDGNLVNAAGLPAVPFRWPQR